MEKEIDFLSQILDDGQLARVRKPAKPVQHPRRPGEKVLDYGSSRPEIGEVRIVDGPAPTVERLERPSPSGSEPDAELDYSATRPELAVKAVPLPKGEERRRMIAEEQRRSIEKGRHEFLLDHGPEHD